MRQVFSSPRIENVEAVARMLEAAGIEVRLNNGRSYRGAIRGNFSYRDQGGGPRPSVWVIRSEQQPEARRILREAGLLQAPSRADSFLQAAADGGTAAKAPAARGGGRFRYGLLLAVAVVAGLALLSWRSGRDERPADAAAGAPATTVPGNASAPLEGAPPLASLPDEAFVVATPPALAATLVREALATRGMETACVAVDGADPGPALLQALAGEGLDVRPASAAGAGCLDVAVARYMTDGSGQGTVELAVAGGAAERIAVRREGRDWFRDAP